MKEFLIFGIFLYLYKNKKSNAKSIAHHFEISTRSVYRIIDALSLCGVHVKTKQGNGGGIEMQENFVLEKLLLNEYEKSILRNLYLSTNDRDLKNVLSKIV